MMWRRCVGLMVLGFSVACVSHEEAAKQFIERGDHDVAAGRDEAAVIDFRNAVKNDPKSAPAQRKLAEAYVAIGRSADAYHAFLSAVTIDPGDSAAQIGLGKLLLESGQYDEAKMRADTVLESDRGNVDAQLIVASALAEMKALGGDRSEAEAAFRTAVKMAGHSAPAHIAFARFLLGDNRPSEAETELRAALAAAPDDEFANRAMAAFCQAQGRIADAEPYFRRAADVPHQKLRSTLALADYLAEGRRYAEARQVLEASTSGGGGVSKAVRLRLAALEYDTGSREKAHQMLDRALKGNPTAEGLALKSRFLAAEGRSADALAAARAALDLDPRQSAAQLVVGTIAAREGRPSEAEHAFTALLRLRPGDTDAKVRLARVKLSVGDADAAASLLTGVASTLDARLTLASAHAAQGDLARARQELTDLSRANPSSDLPLVALAELELDHGNRQAARALSTRALLVAPDSGGATLLAARLAFGDGDAALAEQLLKKVSAADSTAFDAQAMLAQIRAEQGDLTGALKTYQTLAERYPQSAAARTAAGLILQAAGKPADARTWYEEAIALDPNQGVAAAHLAGLYIGNESTLTTAIRLAQKAVDLLPGDPDAHDTLGQAYLKSGRPEVAVNEFEQAASLDAGEPAYRDHLAAAKKAAADLVTAQPGVLPTASR
jgi:cellulose synthase operon protein C